MIWRILVSFLIKLFVELPMILLGIILVPFCLWFGFGWLLWPWGNDVHPDNGGNFWRQRCGTSWWCAYQWFALRNPASNFGRFVLGITATGPEILKGTREIGDKKAGGWYWIRRSWAWEFYYIKPYILLGKRRCIRFRAGWKLEGQPEGANCGFVFAPNPFMPYSGK